MAIDWVNNGSCKDVSNLAEGSVAPSSQAATNTVSDQSAAQSAPGSTSESTAGLKLGDPSLDVPAKQQAPGDDGKPKAAAGNAPDAKRPGWGYIKGGRNG